MSRSPGDRLPMTIAELIDAANAMVPPIDLAEAAALLGGESVTFVDIREPQEWQKLGTVPGAYRAPRGMLEFWVDPSSPYYRPALDDGRQLVLYCGSAWRSALAAAALHGIGRTDVTHIAGGFTAWQAAGYPVEPYHR